MGRPPKETVDYFSHDAVSGKTIFILQSRFGNDGYAAWFKLLALLCRTPGHVFYCSKAADWQFLVAEMALSTEKTQFIVDCLAELDAIDVKLWEKKIIWSQNLVNRLAPVYRERKTPLPVKPTINAVSPPQNGVPPPDNPQNDDVTTVSPPDNRQSILKHTKGKHIKGTKKQYGTDSHEIKLATKLKSKILGNNPRARVPVDLQKWCHEFHLLLSKNGYQPAEVEKVIDYCQDDSFWKTNILSAQKLRLQFDKLFLQTREIKQQGGQYGANRTDSRGVPINREYTRPEDL